MKIKLLTSIGGPNGVYHSAGDVVDCIDTDAKRLIERGLAIPAKQKREKATLKKTENTAL